jgi:DNA topoisomerase-1
MQAYCVKCKSKRDIANPKAVFTVNGTPATQGTCPVCGTKVFRMGRTAEHEGLNPDEHMIVTQGKGKLASKPKLVIVESPTKARTVGRFLGKGYTVKASVGHVRDLPSNRMGVDVDDDFKPRYVIPAKRKDLVRELRSNTRDSSEVYLATDPDREGEAISWHLVQVLKKSLGRRPVHRVEFHEITQDAVANAFAHPRSIDMKRVEAQQARRILDRLVGYALSPLLREKMHRRGLSAGRVQSVAVRLVVEREREIESFIPEEYWSIEAELAKQIPGKESAPSFLAKLTRVHGDKAEIHSNTDAQAIVADLEQASYVVRDIREGQRRRRPAPPFTTSTMQQEASRRLRFTSRRTMRVAQQLYEGMDLGDGPVGLITYMRTDSLNVADSAQQEARHFIAERYGEAFVPPAPPTYRTRTKGAQEAHEAIRPTSVLRTPDSLKPHLDRGQYRLYQLIWRRFVASQMSPAVYDTVAVDVKAGSTVNDNYPYLLHASGSSLRFKGFLAVYTETKDRDDAVEEEARREEIPPLAPGELLSLIQLLPAQHFTQPPARYTEATLVRALEEHGIGRPSTYAPTLATIQRRGYVERREQRLHPTEVGIVVTDLLVNHFADYINVGFTARMEAELDRIAQGVREWVPALREFYEPFSTTLAEARAEMPTVEMGNEPTGESCPRCGHPLVYKFGRYGKFIGCSNFPECRYLSPILTKIGVKCPECGGDLVEKRTRRGRTFYGCSNYQADSPDSCNFATWKRPLPHPCPQCGGLLTEVRKGWAQCTNCEASMETEMLSSAERVTKGE